jgi:hypothetical protein
MIVATGSGFVVAGEVRRTITQYFPSDVRVSRQHPHWLRMAKDRARCGRSLR